MMTRRKTVPPGSSTGASTDETTDGGPERFDSALLAQPPAVRLDYFERNVVIEHTRMIAVCDAVLQSICPPGNGPEEPRPGVMVLVIGPSRVGKTELVKMLEKLLRERALARMLADPGFMPYASIIAGAPGSGRFEWEEYYRDILRQLKDLFIDSQITRRIVRNLRDAMIRALRLRRPYAVLMDEALHIGKVGSGGRLQSQLDHVKTFENETDVSHVLFGTYEMRPFRTASVQLGLRGSDIHFSRYDATTSADRVAFKSVLWAFQRQLPMTEEPLLQEEHWEYLYARSIGCIGLLKMHLNRALALALSEENIPATITLKHLRQTQLPKSKVDLALRAALDGEADLAEPSDADNRLLTDLGLRAPTRGTTSSAVPMSGGEKGGTKRRAPVGERAPGRDPIGPDPAYDEETPDDGERQARVIPRTTR